MEQKPSVGRVVHYVAYGTPGGEFQAGVCRAAIITEVYGPDHRSRDMISAPDGFVIDVDKDGHVTTVGLCVLNPTGQYFNRGVRYDGSGTPGTWHWCERA